MNKTAYKLMYKRMNELTSHWVELLNELAIPYKALGRAFIPYAYDPSLYECVLKQLAPNVCTHSNNPELNNLSHTTGDLRHLTTWQAIKADYFSSGCDYVLTSTVPDNCFDATLLYGYKLAGTGLLLGGQEDALQSPITQRLPSPSRVIELSTDILAKYPKGTYSSPWLYVWLK